MSGLDPNRSSIDVILSSMRQYQRDFVFDFSPQRIALKSRRVGWSDAAAFDVVMTTSGLWEALGMPVKTHNYSIISKRERDAKQFIRYCKRHIRAIAETPWLAPYVATVEDSVTAIGFAHSGRRIQSDTQSPDAGRGQEGHLLKDEAGFYDYCLEIASGADKIPLSDPDNLRITEFSTPNGTSGAGEVFWRKWTSDQFASYSHHFCDIHRAIADGFPLTVDQARASCITEQDYEKEFECKFLAGEREYFDRSLVEGSFGIRPRRASDFRVVGIDVASVSDLTAVVVLDVYGRDVWLSDVHIVSGTPYATGAVLGQEDIVAALLWMHAPNICIMDASSDGAELYARLCGKPGMPRIIPHTFQSKGREWKDEWVPAMRTALEDGHLRIEQGLEYGYRDSGMVPSEDIAEQWVDESFSKLLRPLLVNDFLKIERKLLPTGTVTFASPRGKDGHGDAFWASAMAFSIAAESVTIERSRRLQKPVYAETEAHDVPMQPDYLDLI